jgi:hypothetical protein
LRDLKSQNWALTDFGGLENGSVKQAQFQVPPICSGLNSGTLEFGSYLAHGAVSLAHSCSRSAVTSSLLTCLICEPLHRDVAEECDWLAMTGTHSDLRNTFKWGVPFPDMKDALNRYSKKLINEAVSSLNAPWRTAGNALLQASKREILSKA